MPEPLVEFERFDSVGVLTMKHAAKRNVLSRKLLGELRDRFGEFTADGSLKCVVLRAEGPAFSAGHDLSEIVDRQRGEHESLFALCTEVMEAIRNAPFPVIAQVQGIATAAGCQLAATCDLVVASEEATFATPGVKIGLFCSTPAVALVRAVPTKKAMEMLLTGSPISATEAERIGLVNRVVSRERLTEETLELAHEIAQASGQTLALGKRAFYEQLPLDQAKAYESAGHAMVENAATADAHEGMQAFLEKRKPQWRS